MNTIPLIEPSPDCAVGDGKPLSAAPHRKLVMAGRVRGNTAVTGDVRNTGESTHGKIYQKIIFVDGLEICERKRGRYWWSSIQNIATLIDIPIWYYFSVMP